MLLHIQYNFNRLLCDHSLVPPFHPQVKGLAQIHNEPCSVMQEPLYTQCNTHGYTHTPPHWRKALLWPAGTSLVCTHGLFRVQIQPTSAYAV